jgi:hypothetical protein
MKPGREHTCRIIEAVCLAIATVFTFITLLLGAGWEFQWDWFYLWTLSPYIALFALSRYVGRFNSLAAGAGCVAAVLMLGFTLFAYGDGMYIHSSSTSALIFIYAPFYLIFGGPVVFCIALGVGRFIRFYRT